MIGHTNMMERVFTQVRKNLIQMTFFNSKIHQMTFMKLFLVCIYQHNIFGYKYMRLREKILKITWTKLKQWN